MSFWISRRYKAKKDHRCAWCSGVIVKGFLYAREVGMYDGDFQNHAMHIECANEMHRLADENGGYIDFCGDEERPQEVTTQTQKE